MKEITIACKAADTLPLSKLTIIQGSLKKLSNVNAKKLENSILKYGFSAPIFVWESGIKKPKYNVLDGTQRLTVLNTLKKNGYKIPQLPVVFIQAKNKKEAMGKLLHITSQYGDFNRKGLDLFLLDIDPNEELLETLRLTEGLYPVYFGEETDPYKEWEGMPEYINEDVSGFKDIVVHFKDEESRKKFAKLVGQKITLKTKYMWYPEIELVHEKDRIYKNES